MKSLAPISIPGSFRDYSVFPYVIGETGDEYDKRMHP